MGLDRGSVRTGILACDLERLVPDERVHAELRKPVELDKVTFPGSVCEGESVDAEALHHAQRTWYTTVGHNPHDHVSS